LENNRASCFGCPNSQVLAPAGLRPCGLPQSRARLRLRAAGEDRRCVTHMPMHRRRTQTRARRGRARPQPPDCCTRCLPSTARRDSPTAPACDRGSRPRPAGARDTRRPLRR